MTKNRPNDTKDEPSSQEKPSASDHAENRHTGEGAASAMAHLISQGQQHRHQAGEPDDAAGSRRQ